MLTFYKFHYEFSIVPFSLAFMQKGDRDIAG